MNMPQGAITLGDKNYPVLLKQIKDPPNPLFYKGNISHEIFSNCLGVVGSRSMTTYGKRATDKFVYALVQQGITVVSGFMFGIDAHAHLAAVRAGGKTIAVMPCGIDYIYPENQKKLYQSILSSGGLILSETAGLVKPKTWLFPRRNRIVAGLSKAVLVVEAAEKSGSLITANLCKKYNRVLFVVPGSIFSTNARGIYQLLREGASPAVSPCDIAQCYGMPSHKEAMLFSMDPAAPVDSLKLSILNILQREPLTLNELFRELKTSFSELSACLSLMVVQGLLSEEEGRYYAN